MTKTTLMGSGRGIVDDRPDEFLEAWENNIRDISKSTQLLEAGKILDDNHDRCWSVTSGIEAILGLGELEKGADLRSAMQALRRGQLVVALQDTDPSSGQDHWMTMVGVKGGKAYVFEALDGNCHHVELFHIGDLEALLSYIEAGAAPDRAYHAQTPHQFTFLVYQRRPLTAKSVYQFLASSPDEE